MDYSELYTRNQLSYHSLRNCGFEEAPATSLPNHLYKAEQTQQSSCLRDTVLVALKNFLKLQNILLQAGTIKRWKFYQIVICTMPDRVSKAKRKQALDEIIRLNSLWQVADFRTFFIPIDMVDAEVEEIMSICQFGGPSWVSYPCVYSDFHEQFRQIVREIGLDGKQSLMNSESNIEENHFGNPFELPHSLAVTLSIAANDRLKGEKWEGMVNTIAYYMRNLTSRDLLSGIIFSNQPWVVGGFPEAGYVANQQQRMPFQPRNIPIPAQPRQQYQQYAQPVVIQQHQRVPNNCGRACAICCFTSFFFIIISIILTTSA